MQEQQAGWACPWLEGRPEAVTGARSKSLKAGRGEQAPASIGFYQIRKVACKTSAYGKCRPEQRALESSTLS